MFAFRHSKRYNSRVPVSRHVCAAQFAGLDQDGPCVDKGTNLWDATSLPVYLSQALGAVQTEGEGPGTVTEPAWKLAELWVLG